MSFLRDWKLVVEGDSREALERATKLYEEEVKILEGLDEDKPFEGADLSREIEVLTKARELEHIMQLYGLNAADMLWNPWKRQMNAQKRNAIAYSSQP